MSRTIRRKKINWCGNTNSVDHEVEKRALNRFYLVSRFSTRIGDYEEEKKECLRNAARFHRDGYNPYYHTSIPSWFCNLYYYRRDRARMRDCIRHAIKNENIDEVDFFTHVHPDISWDWW